MPGEHKVVLQVCLHQSFAIVKQVTFFLAQLAALMIRGT
jgi:hypothetical protein